MQCILTADHLNFWCSSPCLVSRSNSIKLLKNTQKNTVIINKTNNIYFVLVDLLTEWKREARDFEMVIFGYTCSLSAGQEINNEVGLFSREFMGFFFFIVLS